MQHNKTRLTAVSAATLALIVAGTATVAAHPGDRGGRGGERGFGAGKAQAERGFGAGQGMMGDRGALRGALRGGLRGAAEDFQRRETTIQTADGTTTHRVEQGTVDSTADSGLEFSLASGEIVSVVLDADTQAVAFSGQTVENRRGISRERMVPMEIEIGAIEAGSEVIVWSGSEDGGDFVADRIVVRPDVEETAGVDAEADAAAEPVDADAAAIAPVTDA
jgi:hypothetical protein